MRTMLDLARLALFTAMFFLFVPRRPASEPIRLRAARRR
jgi:hypothetical protein